MTLYRYSSLRLPACIHSHHRAMLYSRPQIVYKARDSKNPRRGELETSEYDFRNDREERALERVSSCQHPDTPIGKHHENLLKVGRHAQLRIDVAICL